MPQNVGSKSSHSSPKENPKVVTLNDDSPVNFIYKTMVERDPKKRKVKPIEKGYDLLSLNLLDDGSSDEDYQPKNLDEDDDDENEDEEEEDDDEDDDEQESEESEENENEEQTESESIVPETKSEPPKGSLSPIQLNETANNRIDFPTKVAKLLVCSVCLGEVSHENDEIVECDSCGITVHEGCYGITADSDNDNESVHSNASSSSTEPWFCDACKATNASPVCELCPNPGGIFKQTDVGRWVHLVCALYIPGVAFADTNHLTGVTLFELSYDRWGSKLCSLCEDERLSRTGISVCCDAGMCKTYFHVTCAQAQGLLYEAQNADETELIDPFYAHCKLHAGDKSGVKAKRRNWLALQSKQRFRNEKQSNPPLSERILKKLTKAREKWKQAAMKRSPPWVPTQKVPRLLITCPSAVKKLIRKSELLGLSPQTQYIASHDIDVRRKWHIPPAFSIEFVSYYMDRNNRMNSMQKRLEELKSQGRQLKESESATRKKYEELLRQCDSLKMESQKHKAEAKDLWIILNSLSKKGLIIPKLLESVEEKQSKTGKKSEKPHEGNNKKSVPFSSSTESSVLKACGICRKTQDQHKLALCDSCKLNYHLYCLDPPLSRMPKKTRFGGWQCSDCTEKEDTQSDGTHSNQSFVDAPRRLREHVKGPNKFVPDADLANAAGPLCPSSKKRRNNSMSGQKRGRKKKIRLPEDSANNLSEKSATENGSISFPLSMDNGTLIPKRTKLDDECCKCKQEASLRLLVKCDGCLLYYHFSCLNPPVKKSPKQRGYRWFCENCDDSEDGSSEEVDEVDSQEGDTQASSN